MRWKALPKYSKNGAEQAGWRSMVADAGHSLTERLLNRGDLGTAACLPELNPADEAGFDRG
jgi:hypothetical protein